MIYKNNSHTIKTFYGVTFKPGEVKDVPGYINSPKFIRLKSVPKELPERTEVKRRGRPKKDVPQMKSIKISKQAEVNSLPKEDDKSSKPEQIKEGGND